MLHETYVLAPPSSACLPYRTLIGTYLLCGLVRAGCAVLCCVYSTAIRYVLDKMLVHGTKTKAQQKKANMYIWLC